jgi:hypothetical protein
MRRVLVVLVLVVATLSSAGEVLAGTRSAQAPAAPRVQADFNGDGAHDLAVGVPFEDVGTFADAGAVNVLVGGDGGLSGTGSQLFTQDTEGIGSTVENSDRFGGALAVGDFDSDAIDDLAVGAPGEAVGTFASAGAVNVIFGAPGGLNTGRPSLLLTQDMIGVGAVAAGDTFGAALATGRLDGDDAEDLVIGAPLANVGPDADAGLVNIVFGSTDVLGSGRPSLQFTQDSAGVGSDAEPGDNFGDSLTVGDHNSSGVEDLAVGAPGEAVGDIARAGAVNILFGLPDGPDGAGQLFHQGVEGVVSDAETGDEFGDALAADEFGRGVGVDLAVGVPGESVGTVARAGAINVLSGSSGGLVGPGSQLFHQGVEGIGSDPEANDNFGAALATSDFNVDGTTVDLAVGVPRESAGAIQRAGAIHVLFGGPGGLAGLGSQLFHQGSEGVVSDPETPDSFGFALAAGDFNNDGPADLAIGVPLEGVDVIPNAGAINVLYGSSGTGLVGPGSQLFHQDVDGIGSTAEDGDQFGRALGAHGSRPLPG